MSNILDITYLTNQSVDMMIDDVSEDGFFDTLLDYCGGGPIAVLQAYFDESERQNGLLCVAGYGFMPTHARKFSKEFGAVFGSYGGFHMKELVAKKKGYKGISDAKREELIKDAVRIVTEHFSFGVAVAVNMHEYDKFAPTRIRGLSHAYPFLCHCAMMAMVTVAKQRGLNDGMTYIFEAGHSRMAAAKFNVSQMTSTPDLRKFYNYRGHAFLPKSDAVPLQAADLLAWEIGKFKTETLDSEQRDIRMSLLRLIAPDSSRYSIHFMQGERLRVAMDKFRKLGLEQITEDDIERVRRATDASERQIRRSSKKGAVRI